MKRILSLLLVLACIAAVAHPKQSANDWVRDRVVLLKSIKGSCSGEEIQTPSGKTMTLTAGHCKALLINNQMTAEMEDGKEYTLTLIAIDDKSDLMLLAGVPGKVLKIAKSYEDKHQHVHTMTHGHGMPSYRTDGELLKETDNQVLAFLINSNEDAVTCEKIPGSTIEMVSFLQLGCLTTWHSMMTTARIIPGSSGGPLLNDKEELIGVASVSEPTTGFSGMVTLEDIHAFLKDK